MIKTKELICVMDPLKIDEKSYTFYGVECIIVTKNNKLILQRRGDNWDRFPGYLASFGGQIETNETPQQALMRELNEELGAQTKAIDVINLGIITEAATNYTELIYSYFWRDLKNTITGCYEGEIVYFNNAQEIMIQSKIMDGTRWALRECVTKKLL